MLLEDVMEAAQAAEVARAGLAALIEWDAMIEIAAPDGLAAGGEATGSVTGGDEVAEPGWRGVGGAGQGVGAAARGRVGDSLQPGVLGCLGRGGHGALQDDRQVLPLGDLTLLLGDVTLADGDGDAANQARLLAVSTGPVARSADRREFVPVHGESAQPRNPTHCRGPAVWPGEDDLPGHGRVGGCQVGQVAGL